LNFLIPKQEEFVGLENTNGNGVKKKNQKLRTSQKVESEEKNEKK